MSLPEALVSTACTALLAAALLPLVVDGATLAAARLDRLVLEQAALILAAELQEDLDAAGDGLEGAEAVLVEDRRVPVIEAPGAERLRLVLTASEPREVVRLGPARYLADDARGLRRGDRVAALGLHGANPEVPVGRLLRVDRRYRILVVAWPAPAGERIAAWGPPRALVPVTIREYGVRHRGMGTELWRRDDGGPRQPVVDGVAGLEVGGEAGDAITVTVELRTAGGEPIRARAASR